MFTSNNEWFVTKKLITGATSSGIKPGPARPVNPGFDGGTGPSLIKNQLW